MGKDNNKSLSKDYLYGMEVDGSDKDEKNKKGSEKLLQESDDDIYGDLEASVFTSARRKPQHDKELEKKLQEAIKEKERLKSKVKRLIKENRAYATNISSLYLTAKNEIDKKNHIIKQQTSRLQELTSGGRSSSLSKKDVQDILTKCQQAYQESYSKVILQEIKQTVDNMRASKLTKVPKNKKRYKFGNMSVYFHRDQVPFKRKASVEFPPKMPNIAKMTKANDSK